MVLRELSWLTIVGIAIGLGCAFYSAAAVSLSSHALWPQAQLIPATLIFAALFVVLLGAALAAG